MLVPQNFDHFLSNGRSRGQAGGFDSRKVNKVRHVRCLADDKVVRVHVGTHARKAADRVPQLKARHTASGTFFDKMQSGGRTGPVLLFHFFRIRANQQIAIHCWCNQNAFSKFSRALKNRRMYQIALVFVQNIVLAAGGEDMKTRLANQIMYFFRIHTRCIDDIPAFNRPAGDCQRKDTVFFADGGNRTAPQKLCAVPHGHFYHGQRILPRADNTGAGRPQGTQNLFGKVRFFLQRFLCGKQLHIRHTVCQTIFIQMPQPRQVLR